jgi:hypothetical protein
VRLSLADSSVPADECLKAAASIEPFDPEAHTPETRVPSASRQRLGLTVIGLVYGAGLIVVAGVLTRGVARSRGDLAPEE